MRSWKELAFRARQEAANLALLARPPVFEGEAPERLDLPETGPVAAALRESEFAAGVIETAEQILQHRFPLLGLCIETGPEIRWRRDYVSGKESGTAYFRRIPYLDFSAVGDHKVIWELNRHQHLVLLTQAYLFSGHRKFLEETFSQLESWFRENPFQCGINWASALEVAFRALSWIWVLHLAGAEMPGDLRRRLLTGLYRHGKHLEENLSVYFSPNTHLLGEAVALHAIGALFGQFPEAAKWKQNGARIVEEQLDFQVLADGAHFEQSTYYHVYALDLFVFHYLLAGRPQRFRPVLTRMAEYLHWLLGPEGRIVFFGDDDGGRLFHPYGERDAFGRATLTTCGILFGREDWIGWGAAEQAAWWLGAEGIRESGSSYVSTRGARLFPESGMAFLESGDLRVQMDAGAFGYGGAGHSHSDSLSLIVWLDGTRVLVDPGTFTYVADADSRSWFRGSGAHNTVRMDRTDQGKQAGPFRWSSKPEVRAERWDPESKGAQITALCRYDGYVHKRRLRLEPGRLLVIDDIEGPPGEHVCEQIWQLGPAAAQVKMHFSAPTAAVKSRLSPVYGVACPGSAMIATMTGRLPARMTMLMETGEGSGISLDEAVKEMEAAAIAND
jgi:hypothetical protein